MASYPGSFPRTVVSMGSSTSDISYLPTSLVRDVFAVAVVVQHVCSPNAELGLQGTRSVVYSSVYHTTVVARLMGSWGERREEERREGGGTKGGREEEHGRYLYNKGGVSPQSNSTGCSLIPRFSCGVTGM